MQLQLLRRWLTPRSTMGTLAVDGEQVAFTLEPPTAVNKPRAIPPGTYSVVAHYSPRFGRPMPMLAAVPDFSDVLIHVGNYPHDTEGCILVGSARTVDMVLDSRVCWDVLMGRIQRAWGAGEEVAITLEEQVEEMSDPGTAAHGGDPD